MNIIKDLHHLVEKQSFKHIKSLYYRVFFGCSWIKGPLRTLMRAAGAPLSKSRHVHTPSPQVHSNSQTTSTSNNSCVQQQKTLIFPFVCTSPELNPPPPGEALHPLSRATGPGARPDRLAAGQDQATTRCPARCPPGHLFTGSPHHARSRIPECPTWQPHHAALCCHPADSGCTYSFLPAF